MSVYFDFRDWWIGYYRGSRDHYVCLLPTLVIRWPRRRWERHVFHAERRGPATDPWPPANVPPGEQSGPLAPPPTP